MLGQLYPDDYSIYNGLGWVNLELGNYKKSKEYFNLSISLNPKAINSFEGIGTYSYILKEYEEAIRNFNKSITSDPDLSITHFPTYANLGYSYYHSGERNTAIIYFNKSAVNEYSLIDSVLSMIGLIVVYTELEKNNEAEKIVHKLIGFFKNYDSIINHSPAIKKFKKCMEKLSLNSSNVYRCGKDF